MALNKDDVMQVLAGISDPDLGKDLVSAAIVKEVTVDGDEATVELTFKAPADPARAGVEAAIRDALTKAGMDATIHSGFEVARADLPRSERMPTVKNIIGVGAGKGGVGKSTVAVNLAVSLAKSGASVGLLDADVYGPSVPIMMGLADARPTVNPDRKILPLAAHGVVFMSMGLLVKREDAVVWRGPMIARAVTQFIDDVLWGDLDYLIVDLPPGTGDVALSLSQTIPIAGAVVVATPQDVAFADVTRALRMFEMLRVDTLGLVENMAWFQCSECETKHAIFGEGRTAAHCEEKGLPLLGSLPLDSAVSPHADAGKPIVVAEPGSQQALLYRALAGIIAKRQAVVNYQRESATKHQAFFNMQPGA